MLVCIYIISEVPYLLQAGSKSSAGHDLENQVNSKTFQKEINNPFQNSQLQITFDKQTEN